jgi:hypothetical protein
VTVPLIFRVFPSFVGCPAPVPGELAYLACSCDASFLLIRPSVRSFSGWVTVVFFGAESAALQFSLSTSEAFTLPFCVVRAAGIWWCVSVPVSIGVFSLVGHSLPCLCLTLKMP